MKRGLGAGAGLLALLALVLHTQFPAGSETPQRSTATVENSQKTDRQQWDADEPAEGPWLATRAFFHGQRHVSCTTTQNRGINESARRSLISSLISPDEEPQRCELEEFMGVPFNKDDYEMWSIVATVADPAHTRLSYYLDSQLEGIQGALQDLGWEFAGEWLPWIDRFSTVKDGDINERRRRRRLQSEQEWMPGILIFRAGPEGKTIPHHEIFPSKILFILVVPETPTTGLAGAPFFAAMHFADALTTDRKQIGLLAPTFSGSFASLTTLVNNWQKLHPAQQHRLHETVYGDATARPYAEAFNNGTGLDFRSGYNHSEYNSVAFCSFVGRYGIERAAVVSEDETGFGQASAKAQKSTVCPEVAVYRFPRDVSHLRNAYQEASGAKPRDSNPQSTPTLNFSIKDPTIGEDSIPTFADIQTPLRQDAIVGAIANDFKRKDIRLVLINATNSLDTIFLAEMIRRNSPDTRVMIREPDILFIPAAASDPLAGTLFLSTYPMFLDNDEWVSRTNYRRMFAGETAQGLFNVSQLLALEIGAALKPLTMPGYAQFNQLYPSVWLLTLTRSGFYPVDLFQTTSSNWFTPAPTSIPQSATGPPRAWRITTYGVAIGILIACFQLLRCNLSKHVHRPTWLILDGQYAPRLLALLGACLSLTALLWILSAPAFPNMPKLLGWSLGLGFVGIVTGYGGWRILERQEPRNEESGERSWSDAKMQALTAGVIVAVLVIIGVNGSMVPAALTYIGLVAPMVSYTILLFSLWVKYRKANDPHFRLLCHQSGLQSFSYLRGCARRDLRFFISDLGLRGMFYAGLILLLFGLIVVLWYRLLNYEGDHQFATSFFRYRALDLYSAASPALPCAILSIFFLVSSIFYFKRYTDAGMPPELTLFSRDGPIADFYDAVKRHIEAPMQRDKPSQWRDRLIWCAAIVAICITFLYGMRYARAFELPQYNDTLAIAIAIMIFTLAAGCYDLIRIWRNFKGFLRQLQFFPIKPALERVARDLPRQPIWAFQRRDVDDVLVRHMLTALHNRAVILGRGEAPDHIPESYEAAGERGALKRIGPRTPSENVQIHQHEEPRRAEFRIAAYDDFCSLREFAVRKFGVRSKAKNLDDDRIFEATCTELTSKLLRRDLVPMWPQSIIGEHRLEYPTTRAGVALRYSAEFVVLQFCRYLMYVSAQTQRIAWCVSIGFLVLLLLFNSYSPQGPLSLSRFLAVLFVIIGFVMYRVFAGMERNPVLSRIAHTTPGELNKEFWFQLFSLGALPLLALLAHLFPEASHFLFSWVTPSVQEIH